jgi:beta-phosphoglucomutase family hydrolase
VDLNQQYSGLIFDCDGTLTDSMPIHFIAWRKTMSRHGIEFTEDRFYAMGGMRTETIVAILADENSLSLDAKSVANEKEAAFMDRISDLKPRSDICEIARTHLGSMPMAVASGSEKEVVLAQLEIIGLSEAFPVVVAAEDTQRHKPEPDVFLKAAELLGVDPTACLVYEDSPLGFQAAKAAGMDYVDVR